MCHTANICPRTEKSSSFKSPRAERSIVTALFISTGRRARKKHSAKRRDVRVIAAVLGTFLLLTLTSTGLRCEGRHVLRRLRSVFSIQQTVLGTMRTLQQCSHRSQRSAELFNDFKLLI